MSIFPTRTLLQINFTAWVKYQDVNGAMSQVIPMRLGAVRISQDSIVFVDDREGLILRCACIRERRWRDGIREGNPLQQRYLFRASLRSDVQIARDSVPVGDVFANQFSQLFSSLGKPGPDQFQKQLVVALRQSNWITGQNSHHCGIDFRPRKKNGCRNSAQIFHAMVYLHTQGEGSVIMRGWGCGKTQRHLSL